MENAVEIKSRGKGERRRGGGECPPKNIFSALRALVWSKNKGGGGGAETPGPSPGSCTGNGTLK